MYNIEKWAKPILRWGMSFVFLYFGFMQILGPDYWSGFVPGFLQGSVVSANNIVIMNGIMELTLGLFLLIGLYTRFSSLILALHLFFISFNLGFGPLGVRDFGLSIATLVVFLNGLDRYCLDYKMNKSREKKDG